MSAKKDYFKVDKDVPLCYQLYALGYNGFRQITCKELDVIDVPVELVPAENERHGNVVKVVSCLASTFVLWDDGTVSIIGCIPGSSIPGKVPNFLPGQYIKDIACIDDRIILTTQEGKLSSWSDYLSVDSKTVDVESNINISQVSCGDLHAIVRSSDGCISKIIPTSDTEEEEKHQPIHAIERIDFSQRVQSVSCGKEHVLLLTFDGKVFSFGGGSRGQLGTGTLDSQDHPKLIEALDGIHISQISCGGWHSTVKSSSGDVYCWGWNKDGQVGVHDDNVQVQAVPIPVTVTEGDDDDVIVIDVSCGTRHTALVTAWGEVWTWGWGHYGQLGFPVNNVGHQPIKIPLTNASRVWCSHWNTFILVKLEKQDSPE